MPHSGVVRQSLQWWRWGRPQGGDTGLVRVAEVVLPSPPPEYRIVLGNGREVVVGEFDPDALVIRFQGRIRVFVGLVRVVSFDTEEEALGLADRIRATAVPVGGAMPPGGGVSDDDRYRLGVWLDCG